MNTAYTYDQANPDLFPETNPTPLTTALPEPQHLVNLASSSILINVDIGVWTATMQDRQISHEVTSAKKASDESGKFVKNLLANNPYHKNVVNYRQTVYNWLQRRSYDWAGSQRILPIASLSAFMAEYNAHEVEFQRLIDLFLAQYPVIVSNMAFVQGDMFKREDYPTVDQVRNKFHMSLITSEVPQGDFRNAVAADLAADLKNHYQREANRLVEQIDSQRVEQLITVMESISHCCALDTAENADGVIKTKRRRIYDSTVNRALELCDLFKAFSPKANPKLEEARSALATALSKVDNVEMLRESDSLREQVKEDVDQILSKFRMP